MNTWQNLKQACFAAGMSAITLAALKTAAILTTEETTSQETAIKNAPQ